MNGRKEFDSIHNLLFKTKSIIYYPNGNNKIIGVSSLLWSFGDCWYLQMLVWSLVDGRSYQRKRNAIVVLFKWILLILLNILCGHLRNNRRQLSRNNYNYSDDVIQIQWKHKVPCLSVYHAIPSVCCARCVFLFGLVEKPWLWLCYS